MMRPLSILACLACTFIPVGAALAQVQSQAQLDRFQRQLDDSQRQSRLLVDQSIPANERVLIDYGAYITLAFLSLDDPNGKTHQLRQYEIVGYADVNFDGANEFYARLHTLYNDYNSGDAFNGRSDFLTPRIEQAYYRFDLQRAQAAYHGKAIDGDIDFKAGRQLVTWANGLTLSEIVDAGTAKIAFGPMTLDLIAGVTANFVSDFDTSRPDFRTRTSRGLFGGMIGLRAAQHRFFVYGLDQEDYNGDGKLVNNGITTSFNYNSYYLGVGAEGNISDNLLYAVEAVYEGGETLSNSFDPVGLTGIPQTNDRIEAYAFDGRLGYVFADTHRSRLDTEVILASGDGDRLSTNTTLGGNHPGTRDQAFNALGLLNTGLAFSPTVSNLIVVRVGASTFPLPNTPLFRQAQLGADVFLFEKLLKSGPIDERTSAQRYLGMEGDVYANWQITSDVALAIRYGVYFPGRAISGSRSQRDFLYTGLTYAF